MIHLFARIFPKALISDFSKVNLLWALKEQGLYELYVKLRAIVPDISEQYTTCRLESEYIVTKTYAQHAFQVGFVLNSIEMLNLHKKGIVLVDIGDSSGTHSIYFEKLVDGVQPISLNMDRSAVEKIRKRGLKAIHSRAEDLGNYNIEADLLISFQMVEHLLNPIVFFRNLATLGKCNHFLMTVPYVTRSRVGLHHIRCNSSQPACAENVHIFELSPKDWELLLQHTGWRRVYDKIYLQYPKWNIALRNAYRRNDFEGFYGILLERDETWAERYKSW